MSENPAIVFAATFVDELARAGVAHACVCPGSRSAPLAMALYAHPRMRLHVGVDERSAGFMALGVGAATGQPALVVTTSGTAVANLHPAIVEAHHGRTPLIALTADRPPELRDTGATQTIDQTKIFGDAVRWFVDPGVPDPGPDAIRFWRSLAARAVGAALGGPPGPVHVNLPFREPLVPTGDRIPVAGDGRPRGAPWATAAGPSTHALDEDVDDLASAVARVRRGVVVAGAGVGDPAPVHRFAETAGWPLLADSLSGLRAGRFPVTTYDSLLRVESFAREHTPGLVLRVGAPTLSRALERWLASCPAEQIVVDPYGRWADPGRAAVRLVRADPSEALGAVAGRSAPRESPWLGAWMDAERRARDAIDGVLDDLAEPTEPRTARDLARALAPEAALVVAASMPVRDLDWFGGRTSARVYANRGANGIDGFVSTALGVAAGRGDSVVALAGDLAMLHDQNGLLAARGGALDVSFVVVNNDGGGVFSFLPQAGWADAFEPLFGTPHGVDFATLARLHGAGYELVEGAGDLKDALTRAHQRAGINLIEVRTDRRANVEVHERLWAAVRDALAS